ncbi:hypothetical protein GN956_G13702 [Arapaima gigas]
MPLRPPPVLPLPPSIALPGRFARAVRRAGPYTQPRFSRAAARRVSREREAAGVCGARPHGKILSPPQFCQDVSWDPFRNWAPASRVFDREFAPPHFTDVARALGSSSWPGYARSCLSTSSAQLGLWLLKQMSNELSLVRSERGRWTVSLDINQFAPEEITIKLKEGYLEITGIPLLT